MTDLQTSSATRIIKTDQSGRVRYSKEFREEALAAFFQSGMSGTAFAAHCGVNYATFATWVSRAKRKNRTPNRADDTQHFILAEMNHSEKSSPSNGIEILLPGDARVHLRESSQIDLLSSLLKSLA